MSSRGVIAGLLAAAVVAAAGPPAVLPVAAAVGLLLATLRPPAVTAGLLLAVAALVARGASSPLAGPSLLVAGELAFDAAAFRHVDIERVVAVRRAKALAATFAAAAAVSAACLVLSGIGVPQPLGAVAAGGLLLIVARLVRTHGGTGQRLRSWGC